MRPNDDDHELRRAFAALRSEDRRQAPELASVLSRASARLPVRRTAWRPVLAATLALALVAVFVRWRLPPRGEDRGEEIQVAVALLAWRAPTDALLETPGRTLLVAMPDVGDPGSWVAPGDDGRPKAVAAESPRSRKETTP